MKKNLKFAPILHACFFSIHNMNVQLLVFFYLVGFFVCLFVYVSVYTYLHEHANIV